MIMTERKLNNAAVRYKLDPLYKNVLQRQNSYKLAFRNISTFDGQNPVIESLLSKIQIGKITEKTFKNILNKAPNTKDIQIERGL